MSSLQKSVANISPNSISSAYIFAANSPITLSDPDGNDWVVTQTVNYVDGIKFVQYNITTNIAILNNSSTSYDQSTLEQFAAQVKAEMENSYSGAETFTEDAGGGRLCIPQEVVVSWNCTANVRVLTNVSEYKANEHLMEVVDGENMDIPGDGQVLGVGVPNSLRFYVSDFALRGAIGDADGKLVPHEMGHTGGLAHTFQKWLIWHPVVLWDFGIDAPDQITDQPNVMDYGPEEKATRFQIEILYRNYSEGRLNQQDNFDSFDSEGRPIGDLKYHFTYLMTKAVSAGKPSTSSNGVSNVPENVRECSPGPQKRCDN